MLSRLAAKTRWLRLKWAGAQVPRGVTVGGSRLLRGDARGLICEGGVYFSDGVRLLISEYNGKTGRLRIGAGCFFNYFVVIDCKLSVEIGQRVLVGPHTYIGDFDHGISAAEDLRIAPAGNAAPVRIGDDVWIGAGCVVLKGVSIGRGAVIGAGSVVTRDVPEATVAVGVPAKVIRSRIASDKPQT